MRALIRFIAWLGDLFRRDAARPARPDADAEVPNKRYTLW